MKLFDALGKLNGKQSGNERYKKKSFVVLLFFLLVFGNELLSWAVFKNSHEVFFANWLGIVPFLNERFAFSVPLPVWCIYAAYAAVLGAAVWYVAGHGKHFSPAEWLAWIFIFAGAAGNVGERLVLGFVRDFLYIAGGIFNGADACILAGIAMLMFSGSSGRNAVRRTATNIRV